LNGAPAVERLCPGHFNALMSFELLARPTAGVKHASTFRRRV
jgi:hypothetical protein